MSWKHSWKKLEGAQLENQLLEHIPYHQVQVQQGEGEGELFFFSRGYVFWNSYLVTKQ
jgi:hypothetical protein